MLSVDGEVQLVEVGALDVYVLVHGSDAKAGVLRGEAQGCRSVGNLGIEGHADDILVYSVFLGADGLGLYDGLVEEQFDLESREGELCVCEVYGKGDIASHIS